MFKQLENGSVTYSGCGLDNVILRNGFKLKTFGEKTTISISDIDALWEVIAQTIVTSKPRLEGQDVRFLRGKMSLSQDKLAQALGFTRQTIIGWEMHRNDPIPETPDRLLRLLYDAETESRIFSHTSVNSLTQLNYKNNQTTSSFKHLHTHWLLSNSPQ